MPDSTHVSARPSGVKSRHPPRFSARRPLTGAGSSTPGVVVAVGLLPADPGVLSVAAGVEAPGEEDVLAVELFESDALGVAFASSVEELQPVSRRSATAGAASVWGFISQV